MHIAIICYECQVAGQSLPQRPLTGELLLEACQTPPQSGTPGQAFLSGQPAEALYVSVATFVEIRFGIDRLNVASGEWPTSGPPREPYQS
jgi:hypothetical protein